MKAKDWALKLMKNVSDDPETQNKIQEIMENILISYGKDCCDEQRAIIGNTLFPNDMNKREEVLKCEYPKF